MLEPEVVHYRKPVARLWKAFSPVLPFGEPVYETKDQDAGAKGFWHSAGVVS